ncbi:hypothetical protein IU471_00780 [Nocardia elegans]|uniref:hypothetical protein n=1 Tax=Nocardia elegans TaxID=300029 RepID=UPI001894D1BC|nr:hypothetical protein [Nocardia elegans]MBF6242112.1 hypothetical protein [Nocardia elegans]
MSFHELDRLGGGIRARTESRADDRTHSYFDRHACHALTEKDGPFGGYLPDQLLNRLLDGDLRPHHSPGLGDLTNPRNEGPQQTCQHRHRRYVDGEFGVLGIGSPVFELLREALTVVD